MNVTGAIGRASLVPVIEPLLAAGRRVQAADARGADRIEVVAVGPRSSTIALVAAALGGSVALEPEDP